MRRKRRVRFPAWGRRNLKVYSYYRPMRLLVFLLLVSACSSPAEPALRTPTAAGEQRYLALGDSYTIGEGVAEAERWPVQLSAALRAQGLPVAPPQIVARTGWTTDELAAALDAAEPQGPFDLVTLLIGVNNQYRGRSVAEYQAQFRALLVRAIGYAGARADRVIVVSIPDWGVTPFAEGRDRAAIAGEINAFNAAAREIAARQGVAFVDVTEISRARPAAVTDDGLHPSGAQYAAWMQAVLPVAQAALR